MTLKIDVFHHFMPNDEVMQQLTDLRNLIMSSKEEVLAALQSAKDLVDATAAQNAKANAEISAAIAANTAAVDALHQQVTDLQAQIAANADIPPEIVALSNALVTSAQTAKDSSQKLDDLTPDAPTA